MNAARFVAEHATRLARLVNESHVDREPLVLSLTPDALRRLEAMVEAWETNRATLAGELLEMAVTEVWAVWQEREGTVG